MKIARHLVHLLTALVVAAALFATAPTANAGTSDVNCSDFNTQAAAQNWFINHGGPQYDPAGLDGDGNGIACQSNPCPCSTNQGGGSGGGTGHTESSQPKVKHQKARVVRVVDGDTLEVKLMPGPKVKVRLLGIDTPEVYGGVECGGPQASSTMKKILPGGTIVRLTSDPTQQLKDRYSRLLRYVAKRKLDVGRRLLYTGHAKVYVYNHKPFQRVKSYRSARSHAQQHNRGIWKNC